MRKVQFILKKNQVYSFVAYTRRSSGLWNSTHFIVEALRKKGVEVDIVEVHDNNDIDREVTRFKPDTVIIEALWVVPEKFDVLRRLHPDVEWFCHMHSGLPFLALEGIAMGWLLEYLNKKSVRVIANSPETFDAFNELDNFPGSGDVLYLPNVYRRDFRSVVPRMDHQHSTLNIACLGAVRPMKNHLTQAIAALKYARSKDQYLKFYVNATRVEVGGDPCLKNLRQLFENQVNAELVELQWMEPDEMIHFLHKHIDIGLQVSLTETFNVVSADYVTAGVPVVCSKEVPWISALSYASDSSPADIAHRMRFVQDNRLLALWNQRNLRTATNEAAEAWYKFAQGVE